MSFKEFAKELNGNRIEGELIRTVFYSMLTSIIVIVILYYLKLKSVSDFFPKYGLFLFLAALSFALITATLRQVRAYKEFACMSGMMIGMTTGMIAGFLSGFYIGATNGMFVGGLFGMAIGIWLGVWMGKCCGVMGFMEGIMAGFMGGWMGAMTAVMLLNDNLRSAAIIIFVISSIILVSLNYMIYREMKESEKQKSEDHMLTVIVTFVLVIFTIWLMVYGPRSALFG